MGYNRLVRDRIAVIILEAVGVSGEIKKGTYRVKQRFR